MPRNKFIDRAYQFFLSENSKDKAEVYIIWLSIASFSVHLFLILLNNLGVFDLGIHSELLENPISAIYTPFSFILLFEVYLLVYHIPQSTSDYIGKQYEIITLIVVRRLFKDISHLDLTEDWFQDAYDLQFTFDIVTTILLFLLIYYFHKLNHKKPGSTPRPYKELSPKVQRFIDRKKVLAICLVPIVFLMSIYSFGNWTIDSLHILTDNVTTTEFTDINNIFFDEFFVLLILTDVLLLLFSFFHTSKFNLFIRNSGFIISTILIRLSFGTEGYLNNILITGAVLFGVLILLINQKYEKLSAAERL